MDAEDINWNDMWNQILEQHRKSKSGDCANAWNNRESAAWYNRMSRENNWEKSIKQISGMSVSPEYSVLDIGAGPGNLAIPLARKVKHVTVVEPADWMMSCLKENIGEEQATNIKCVQKRWEDVNIKEDLDPPYELVLASFSLGMRDIRKSIEKMNAVSSRHVYLYWFSGWTSWEKNYAEIWRQLHGKEYIPAPKSNYIYNLLYEMDIYPNMETNPVENNRIFQDLEDALDYFKPKYRITNKKQESTLRKYLKEKMQIKDGKHHLKGSSYYTKIWWNTR